jgi:hypothetical protein
MPDQIKNILIVVGQRCDVDQFEKDNSGICAQYGEEEVCLEHHDFTLNAQVPVPQDTLNTGFENGQGNDWQTENWGTKWDAGDVEEWEDYDHGEVVDLHFRKVSFETPYNTPDRWLDQVAEKNKNLCFFLHWCDEYTTSCGNFFLQVVVDQQVLFATSMAKRLKKILTRDPICGCLFGNTFMM